MRTPAILIWRATTLAWLALALVPALAVASVAQARDRQIMAQATDEEEDGQPASVSPEPEPAQPEPAEEPARGLANPPRLGDSRRLDPFDANDERPARPPPAAAGANPDHDVVVCEAGCDGPRGEVVYKKKKQPRG